MSQPSAGEYALACVCPCSIACCAAGRSKAFAATADGDTLIGMDGVARHTGMLKNQVLEYEWTVESWSWERSANDGGRGTNRKGRVRQSEATTTQNGVLTTADASVAFEPITRAKRLALLIELSKPDMEPSFAKLYQERKKAFIAAAKERGKQRFLENGGGGLFGGQCQHDVKEAIWLRNMHDDVAEVNVAETFMAECGRLCQIVPETSSVVKHVDWSSSAESAATRPCCADLRYLAALTGPTAMCWLYSMSQSLAYRARAVRASPDACPGGTLMCSQPSCGVPPTLAEKWTVSKSVNGFESSRGEGPLASETSPPGQNGMERDPKL